MLRKCIFAMVATAAAVLLLSASIVGAIVVDTENDGMYFLAPVTLLLQSSLMLTN